MEVTEKKMDYCSFIDDEEKMRDFLVLSREDFLKSYSYLTEEEYDLTEDELVYPAILEKLGWSIRDRDERNGKFFFDIAQSSPAGEDFSIGIWFYGTTENLVEEIKDAAYYFDPDEHIEMWIEARGNKVSGVPDTRTLVKDAEAIQKMLEELASALDIGVYYADKAAEVEYARKWNKWCSITRDFIYESAVLSASGYDGYKLHEAVDGINKKVRSLLVRELKKLGIEMPTED